MIRDTLLEHPLVYLAWQAPFIEEKLRPVFQHNDPPVAAPGAVKRLGQRGVGMGKPDGMAKMGLAQQTGRRPR